jgi:hypothetical protein
MKDKPQNTTESPSPATSQTSGTERPARISPKMSDEMLLKAALADGLTSESHWASITQDPDREWAARWLFRTAHGTEDWEQMKEPGDLDSGIETVIENERLDEQEKSNSPFYQILMDELQNPQK